MCHNCREKISVHRWSANHNSCDYERRGTWILYANHHVFPCKTKVFVGLGLLPKSRKQWGSEFHLITKLQFLRSEFATSISTTAWWTCQTWYYCCFNRLHLSMIVMLQVRKILYDKPFPHFQLRWHTLENYKFDAKIWNYVNLSGNVLEQHKTELQNIQQYVYVRSWKFVCS